MKKFIGHRRVWHLTNTAMSDARSPMQVMEIGIVGNGRVSALAPLGGMGRHPQKPGVTGNGRVHREQRRDWTLAATQRHVLALAVPNTVPQAAVMQTDCDAGLHLCDHPSSATNH